MANPADPQPDQARRSKSPDAFRTISEVATEIGVPAHVLRFWETKFSQIKPMKRGGGRRYYRPEDVALLRQIRTLLYSDGYTIKGVRKLLKEGGVSDAARPSAARPNAATTDAAAPQGGAQAAGVDAAPPTQPPTQPPPGPSKAQLRALLQELEAARDLLKQG